MATLELPKRWHGRIDTTVPRGPAASLQFRKHGAFVQETIVNENQCIPIPKEIPFASASLIGCGVITGTGAVFNRAKVQIGDTVVVIGAGGVGLNVYKPPTLSAQAKSSPLIVSQLKRNWQKIWGNRFYSRRRR